ncbi:MAG: zinc-ribbon domain-containing protein, partial [Pseudomonadota bacterium]|nr:zinc-ribbon domain-containing protein [Pseudomonadota bacterium]
MPQMRRYLSDFPHLIAEWDSLRSRPSSNHPCKSAEGLVECQNGEDHEWEATIANRTNGSNCPFCSGKQVSKTNDLETKFPKIAEQWHLIKNGSL